jgi:hypothetical protein
MPFLLVMFDALMVNILNAFDSSGAKNPLQANEISYLKSNLLGGSGSFLILRNFLLDHPYSGSTNLYHALKKHTDDFD